MYQASVIVTLNNEFPLTDNFFHNLLEISSDDIEIIAVIDGDTDLKTYYCIQELSRLHKNIKLYLSDSNQGFSIANNIGVSLASSPYLIFLNSDTFPIGNALYSLIEYMNLHTMVGVTQGMILYPQTGLVQSTGHIFGFYKTTHAFDGLKQSEKIVNQAAERQALASGFYITRHELFDRESGFDTLYYNAWEGLEYSLKISLSGYKCMYYPNAKAYHVKGSGRNRRFRDESYQTGYFWHKWGDKIKIDLPDFWNMQFLQKDRSLSYIFVNASGIRNNVWELLLEKTNIRIFSNFVIDKPLSKKNISLEDSVPASILHSESNIVFAVDNYRDIINNRRVFNLRRSFYSNDIIIDLNGNVTHLSHDI